MMMRRRMCWGVGCTRRRNLQHPSSTHKYTMLPMLQAACFPQVLGRGACALHVGGALRQLGRLHEHGDEESAGVGMVRQQPQAALQVQLLDPVGGEHAGRQAPAAGLCGMHTVSCCSTA